MRYTKEQIVIPDSSEVTYMTLKINNINGGEKIETEIVDAIPIEWFERQKKRLYREIDTRPLTVDEEERGAEFFETLNVFINKWKFEKKAGNPNENNKEKR